MIIYNATQHISTREEREAGVIDFPPKIQDEIRELLTFDNIPDVNSLRNRAMKIADIIASYHIDIGATDKEVGVLLGGAPWFMPELEAVIATYGFIPMYAFSKRVSKEVQSEDGSVEKVIIFKFEGFVTK